MAKRTGEITELLTKLYTMQEDVGATPKTSDEEKKLKAQNVNQASMGKGRAAKKSGSRFLELKSTIVNRLKTVHELLKKEKERESEGFGAGNNPKETIKAQATMREEIRQASEEWKEMNALYKKEASKKKSKFTQEELEIQATMVGKLQREIEKMKSIQAKGFARGDASENAAMDINMAGLPAVSTFGDVTSGGGGGGGWTAGPSGVEVTADQRMQIQQLEDRDADFDNQLDDLGEGIQDLAEIAQMQGEEVQRQNAMLDQLGKRIDKVSDKLTSVNGKMKETLEEVGRSSDKLIVDIICIVSVCVCVCVCVCLPLVYEWMLAGHAHNVFFFQVLAVGFAAVFYNMSKNNNNNNN